MRMKGISGRVRLLLQLLLLLYVAAAAAPSLSLEEVPVEVGVETVEAVEPAEGSLEESAALLGGASGAPIEGGSVGSSHRPRSRRSSRSPSSVIRLSGGRRTGSNRSTSPSSSMRSSSTANSNKKSWLSTLAGYVSTIVLGVLLAYVLLAERRAAAAAAIQEREAEQGEAAEESRKATEKAIERETEYCNSAKEEIDRVEAETAAATKLLQQLQSRTDALMARAAAASLEENTRGDEELDAVRERMQKALTERYAAHLGVDMMTALQGVDDEAAAEALLRELQQETKLLEEEDKRIEDTVERLQKSETVEEVLQAKQEQLQRLLDLVSQSRSEVEALEQEVKAEEAAAGGDSAEAKEESKKLEEDIKELEEELQVLKEQLHQKEIYESLSPEQKELVDAIRAADKEKEALEEELERTRQSPSLFLFRKVALEDGMEDLQKNAPFINTLITPPQPSPDDVDPLVLEQKLSQLYPEEQRLVDAKRDVVQASERLQTVEAEIEVDKARTEDVELARALCDLLRAKASITEDEMREAGALDFAKKVAESAAAAAEGKPQSIKDITGIMTDPEPLRLAKDLAAAAERSWLDSQERRLLLFETKNELEGMLVEAREATEEAERAVERLETMLEKRMKMPEAEAFARMDRDSRMLGGIGRAVRRLKSKYSNFTKEMFDPFDPEVSTHLIWSRHLEEEVDDVIVATRMFEQIAADMRYAKVHVDSSIWKQKLTESLQEKTPQELFTIISEGLSSPFHRQYVEARWGDIQTDLVGTKIQMETNKVTEQALRDALKNVADSKYWSPGLPQHLVSGYCYLSRLEETFKYLDKKDKFLESISRRDVEQDVTEALMDAIQEAIRRREKYGDDEEVLSALHEAATEAIADTEKQVESSLKRAEKKEADIAPPYDPSLLPRVEVLPEPEGPVMTQEEREEDVLSENPEALDIRGLGDLTGLTLPGVMQLRPRKTKKQ